MKNRKKVFTATMVAFAFAFAPVLVASPAPQGGPDPVNVFATTPHNRGTANSEAIPEESVISVHSTDNVTRGKTGTFVLTMNGTRLPVGTYVKFSVSGSAIQGVDYVTLVSPAYIGQSGYGVIQVQTLADPRGSYGRQAYSVVITLEPGAGYEVGANSSATMWIKP